METRILPSKYVDPKTVVVRDHVNAGQKVTFEYYRDDEFWYRTDQGLLFPVPLKDIQAGKASLLASDKALYFMRWIRKYVETCKEEV
jgi:hypothetical protein